MLLVVLIIVIFILMGILASILYVIITLPWTSKVSPESSAEAPMNHPVDVPDYPDPDPDPEPDPEPDPDPDPEMVELPETFSSFWMARSESAEHSFHTAAIFDSEGNLYMTSKFLNNPTVTVYNADGNSAATLATTSSVVVKYDADGVLLWNITASLNMFTQDIAMDELDNVYVAWIVNSPDPTATVTDTAATPIAVEYGDEISPPAVVFKFNSNGVYQWHFRTKVTQPGVRLHCKGDDLFVQTTIDMNPIVMSLTNATLFIGTTGDPEIPHPFANVNDIELLPDEDDSWMLTMKLSLEGVLNWYMWWANFRSTGGLAVTDDSIYLAGNTSANEVPVIYDVAGNAVKTYNLSSTTSTCLVCYTLAGSFQWAAYTTGTRTTGSRGVACLNNRLTLVLRHSEPTTSTFYDSQDVSISTTNEVNQRASLIQYDLNGNILWISGFMSSSNVLPQDIQISSAGHLYISLLSVNTVTFRKPDGTDSTIISQPPLSGGGGIGVLVRYSRWGKPVSCTSIDNVFTVTATGFNSTFATTLGLALGPNNTIGLSFTRHSSGNCTIYPSDGSTPLTTVASTTKAVPYVAYWIATY